MVSLAMDSNPVDASDLLAPIDQEAGESLPLPDGDFLIKEGEVDYQQDFVDSLLAKAAEKDIPPQQYLDGVRSYLEFMPDYIPSLDDGRTVDDDSRSLIEVGVRKKLEAVLGCPIPKSPPGYRYTGDSLYVELTSGPEVACGLIFIAARGYNKELDVWTIRLVFLNHNGDPVVLDIPSQLLQRQADLVKLLLEKGFRIFRTGGKGLKEYLMSLNPLKRMEVFHRQGLVTSREGYHYFIFNGEVIGDEDDELVYLPVEQLGHEAVISERGTLDEWKTHVASPCRGSPMLVFMLCMAFVSIITKALKRSSFAVALYSDSSTGKTTGLQVCASTMGPGGDPAKNQPTCINNCRHTNNHLELLAQAYDSQPLLLDEIGMSEGRDVAQMLYMLIDGRGKGRMRPMGGSRGITGWHTIPIVSGEISFLSFIRSKDGSLKNGHIARMLDIPVDQDTMIMPRPGETAAEMSDHLKEMCQDYYGTAFKSFANDFIRAATITPNWFEDLKADIKSIAGVYRDQMQRSHEKRAAEHFSVIQYAGKLAVRLGILPFSEQEVASSVEFAFNAWASGLQNKDELDYALDDLRSFVSSNLPGFVNPKTDVSSIRHVGYKFSENGVECLGFEEGLLDKVLEPTVNRKRLYARLADNNMLLKLADDRNYVRRTVVGKGNLKLILIKLDFLSQ